MKTAIAVIVSGCAIFGAAAASADTHAISLSKGVKLCKAQMEQYAPALKSFAVNYEDSTATETHLQVAFKATNAEGRLDRFTCTVDRKERKAVVTLNPPRSGAYSAPEYAGQQRVASND